MPEALAVVLAGAVVGGAIVEVTWEIARRKYQENGKPEQQPRATRATEIEERRTAQA